MTGCLPAACCQSLAYPHYEVVMRATFVLHDQVYESAPEDRDTAPAKSTH
jgi:hypothetical protein